MSCRKTLCWDHQLKEPTSHSRASEASIAPPLLLGMLTQHQQPGPLHSWCLSRTRRAGYMCERGRVIYVQLHYTSVSTPPPTDLTMHCLNDANIHRQEHFNKVYFVFSLSFEKQEEKVRWESHSHKKLKKKKSLGLTCDGVSNTHSQSGTTFFFVPLFVWCLESTQNKRELVYAISK